MPTDPEVIERKVRVRGGEISAYVVTGPADPVVFMHDIPVGYYDTHQQMAVACDLGTGAEAPIRNTDLVTGGYLYPVTVDAVLNAIAAYHTESAGLTTRGFVLRVQSPDGNGLAGGLSKLTHLIVEPRWQAGSFKVLADKVGVGGVGRGPRGGWIWQFRDAPAGQVANTMLGALRALVWPPVEPPVGLNPTGTSWLATSDAGTESMAAA